MTEELQLREARLGKGKKRVLLIELPQIIRTVQKRGLVGNIEF